jgi:YVTN family beta-propeller protein
MRSFFALICSLVSFLSFAQNASFPPSPRQLVAVNPVTNKVYIANEAAGTVTVLNNANNTTATINVGSRPQFIVVNPITNKVYVNNGGDASLSVIDGATDTNTTPTALAVGSQGPMAIDVDTNMLYIVRMTSVATDEVTYFNATANTWYTIATESFQPTALTVNPFTDTLYVAHYGTGDVRVISATNTGELHPTTFSISTWTKPFAIAANTSTNKVYVITEDSRGPIGIIDGATRTVTFPMPTAGHAVSPKALAVNPATNRIYAAFASEVIVIDGNTNAYTYIPVDTGTGAASIGINTYTNRIYVSNTSGTLTIIDGTTNATSTVEIPAGTISMGVNPVTNRIYVAGGTTAALDGVAASSPAVQPTTNIAALAGNSSGPSGSITMSASNAVPNPLPVRGVFYQIDGTAGAWQAASGAGNGPYTASYTGLSAGAHTIYAFAAEGHVTGIDTGQQSAPQVGSIVSYQFTVGSLASPTVNLASSRNPSTVGESVTFTASVTGSSGTPTGRVTFKDGSTAITGCSTVTMASGSATCTTSALAVGPHSITAQYLGDATYSSAVSYEISQTVQATPVRMNVALASNGGSATASSTDGAGFPVSSLIDGDRAGRNWGNGGGWRDATPDVYPDWVEIAFSGTKNIDTVIVYSLQDWPANAVEPTDATTFAEFGATSFTVEAWNGSAWVPVGSVTGNNLVKRAVTFAPASTTKIRVQVTGTASNRTRLVEIEAFTVGPTPTRKNLALASNGGSATASSTDGAGFPVSSLIDGDRAGRNWGNGGGWRDATPDAYPDWVEIAFAGTKTVDTVTVYSLQDWPANAVEPTDTTTFTEFGATSFTVEAWNGSAWVQVGSVTGNNLVKRAVTFSPASTAKIRVLITGTASNRSRLVEIEAWGS